MSNDLALRWHATKFDGSPPLRDDGSCYDDLAPVGRVSLVDFGPHQGMWSWSMTATGFGRDRIRTAGREPAKEAAKAALEQSYGQLLSADSRNRSRWQEHCSVQRWRTAFHDSRGAIGTYETWLEDEARRASSSAISIR